MHWHPIGISPDGARHGASADGLCVGEALEKLDVARLIGGQVVAALHVRMPCGAEALPQGWSTDQPLERLLPLIRVARVQSGTLIDAGLGGCAHRCSPAR